MADNFAKFSTGHDPYYRPFINLNHKDELGSGLLTGARFDGSALHLDADHVPESVGAWANAKRLHSASVEFWQPKRDAAGNLIGTFMMPSGEYSPTPVIKCLSLLGNDAPGMKGMSELPVARFSDRYRPDGKPVKFSGGAMDELINQLAAKGFDTTKMTDLNTLLQYLIDCGATPSTPAAATAADPGEGQTAPVPMADVTATGGGIGGGLAVPSITSGAAGSPAPTSLTLKFNDSTGKPVVAVIPYPPELARAQYAANQSLALIVTRGAAVAADLKRQRDTSKGVAIKAFSDRMATANVAPATIAAQVKVLSVLDHDAVKKFADGKGTGTQLEEMIAALEAGAVPGKPFKEQLPNPHPGAAPGGLAGGGGTGGDFSARKAAMLASDPLFANAQRQRERAALAAKK